MSVKNKANTMVAVGVLELLVYIFQLSIDLSTAIYYLRWLPLHGVGIGLIITLAIWLPLINGNIAKNSWHLYNWKKWTISLLTLSIPIDMLVKKIKLAIEALKEPDTNISKSKLIKAKLALNHQIRAVCVDYVNPVNAIYKSCIANEDVQAFQVLEENTALNNVQTPTSSASIANTNQPVMGLMTYLRTAYSMTRETKALFYQMTENSSGNLINAKASDEDDDFKQLVKNNFNIPNRLLDDSGIVICNDVHYYAQFKSNFTITSVVLVKRTAHKIYVYAENDYTKLIYWYYIQSFALKLYGLLRLWNYYPEFDHSSLIVVSPVLTGLIWLLTYRWSRDSWAIFSVGLPSKFAFTICRIIVLCAIATNSTYYAGLLFLIGKLTSTIALCLYLAFMKIRKNHAILSDPVERYLFETKNNFLLQLVEGIIYIIAGFILANSLRNTVMGAAVAIFTIITQVGGLICLWCCRKMKKVHWDFQIPVILLQQLKNIEEEREIVYTPVGV